jgi:hypothetical protein
VQKCSLTSRVPAIWASYLFFQAFGLGAAAGKHL